MTWVNKRCAAVVFKWALTTHCEGCSPSHDLHQCLNESQIAHPRWQFREMLSTKWANWINAKKQERKKKQAFECQQMPKVTYHTYNTPTVANFSKAMMFWCAFLHVNKKSEKGTYRKKYTFESKNCNQVWAVWKKASERLDLEAGIATILSS